MLWPEDTRIRSKRGGFQTQSVGARAPGSDRCRTRPEMPWKAPEYYVGLEHPGRHLVLVVSGAAPRGEPSVLRVETARFLIPILSPI